MFCNELREFFVKRSFSHLRVSYIAVAYLIACVVPLYLAELPSSSFLVIAFLSALVLFHIKRGSILLLILVFIVSLFRFSVVANSGLDSQLEYDLSGQWFSFTAKVSSFPKKHKEKVTFNVEVISSDSAALSMGKTVKLACYNCDVSIKFAETLQVKAKLKPIRGSASWAVFDYEKYALATGLIATGYIDQKSTIMLSAAVGIINRSRAYVHREIQSSLKRQEYIAPEIPRNLNSSFSSSGLVLALLIGDKSLLSPATIEVFKTLGLSHLIAISGLHIGFVFLCVGVLCKYVLWGMFSVLRQCPYRLVSSQTICLVVGLTAAFAYSALAGFTIPTQRALIMLSIYCVTKIVGWKLSLFDLLSATVLLILIVKPLNTLLLGFWLSVLAVSMICLISKSKEFATLSQLRLACVMMPITFLFFHDVYWLSPLCNLVMIPVVGFILIPVLFLSLLLSIIGLNVGFLWSSIDMFLIFMFDLLQRIASSQNHYFDMILPVGSIQLTIALILIALLIALWRVLPCRHIFVLLISLLLMVKNDTKLLSNGEFVITVLDVGQGLAIVIETKSGVDIYDSGIAFTYSDSAKSTIIPYLRTRNIKELENIVISHGDNDHIGGLNSLIDVFPKTKVFTTNEEVMKREYFQPCYSQDWARDGVNFKIFHQVQGLWGRNDQSCVLRISSQFGSILLPGDIERPAEHKLALTNPKELKSSVLVLPHHGSKTSSSPVFLNSVKPEYAVVSASYFSPYGHPHKSVVRRAKINKIELLSTATSGTVQFEFKKGGIHTREYRANNPHFWYSQN